MLTIFHTNDLHGRLDEAMARRVSEWKLDAGDGALYFDSGDCIKAGNLAIPIRQEPAWGLLRAAGCDAGTLGNRESHPLEAGFRAKLRGAAHPILVANLRKKGSDPPFPGLMTLERNGIKVGVIGAMVPMVTERMAAARASAYLWDPPIPAIVDHARGLRGEVDCLIAITHIGYAKDRELASACPELDLILGGHSHTLLEQPEQMGETFVCQGGAFGNFIGVYRWAARGRLEHAELRPFRI
jgi:5'-nucleotidase